MLLRFHWHRYININFLIWWIFFNRVEAYFLIAWSTTFVFFIYSNDFMIATTVTSDPKPNVCFILALAKWHFRIESDFVRLCAWAAGKKCDSFVRVGQMRWWVVQITITATAKVHASVKKMTENWILFVGRSDGIPSSIQFNNRGVSIQWFLILLFWASRVPEVFRAAFTLNK